MDSIILKTDELVEAIRESNDYKEYLKLKDEMINNKEIMDLIQKVKTIQKEIVINNSKKINTEEAEINLRKTLEELNSYELYMEFSSIQEKINIELQTIKNTIENKINSITN